MGSLSACDAPVASFAALSTLQRTSDLRPKGTGGYCLQRIRRACLDYARWLCERHVTSYSAGIAAYGLSRSMPRPGTLRNAFRRVRKALFDARRCSFSRPQPFDGKRSGLVLPYRATFKLRAGTQRWAAASHCPLQPCRVGLESAVHPPFRRHSAYSAAAIPDYSEYLR